MYKYFEVQHKCSTNNVLPPVSVTHNHCDCFSPICQTHYVKCPVVFLSKEVHCCLLSVLNPKKIIWLNFHFSLLQPSLMTLVKKPSKQTKQNMPKQTSSFVAKYNLEHD